MVVLVPKRPERHRIHGGMYVSLIADFRPLFLRQRTLRVPRNRPDPTGLIVPRHPAMSVYGVAGLIGNDRVARQQELSQPPVVSVVLRVPPGRDDQTVF